MSKSRVDMIVPCLVDSTAALSDGARAVVDYILDKTTLLSPNIGKYPQARRTDCCYAAESFR